MKWLLSDGIQRTHYNSHEVLFKYRTKALQGMMKARKMAAKIKADNNAEKDKNFKKNHQEDFISSEPTSIASELTLIMIFPLIESVSKIDSGSAFVSTIILILLHIASFNIPLRTL